MGLVEGIQELLASTNVPLLSAFLLGLLVSLSPCPLATNVAALAYLGKDAGRPMDTLAAGVLYTAGRAASYALLAGLMVALGLEAGRLAWLLQDVGQYLLGPILLVAGLMVLEVVPLPLLPGLAEGLPERLADSGWLGAFAIGAFFALAFCPYSAALFFGVLIPMALSTPGGIALAPAFALGSALPVFVGVALLVAGVSWLTAWANSTRRVEPHLRRAAGVALVGAGVYATWQGLVPLLVG